MNYAFTYEPQAWYNILNYQENKTIHSIMKNLVLFLFLAGCLAAASCSKDSQSDAFANLTGVTWVSDSLLANGVDASGPGGMLENFKGEVKFNEDYSGSFGNYTGTWRFAYNETQIVISTESLPLPITTSIVELTKTSLKVTTIYPNPQGTPTNIRMTFKAK
jgi:hypothetical protein